MVTGILALTLIFLPHERLLMSRAKRIVSVTNGFRSPCLWLSDHDAILLIYHSDGDHFEFTHLNADTGSQTSMVALNRKYATLLKATTITPLMRFPNDMHRVEIHIPINCSMSSDKQWLFFCGSGSGGNVYKAPFATTLDGSREISFPDADLPYKPLWLHDNRHWIEPVYDFTTEGEPVLPVKANFHDLGDPKQMRSISITGTIPGEILGGITKSDRLLQLDEGAFKAPATTVKMADYAILPSANAVHRYRLRLPMMANVSDVVISPGGGRLAWLLEYDSTPPLTALLHRFIASVPLHSSRMIGLWVSNLDGSEMTEIGHMSVLPTRQNLDYIGELQWLPGEKRLSFIYRGGLYTVETP
jgi:hypothetical protein